MWIKDVVLLKMHTCGILILASIHNKREMRAKKGFLLTPLDNAMVTNMKRELCNG